MESLKCPLCCSTTFSDKESLINHLVGINSNLSCSICNWEASNLCALISHLEDGCFNSESSFNPTSKELSKYSIRQKKRTYSKISTGTDFNVAKGVVTVRKRKPLRTLTQEELSSVSSLTNIEGSTSPNSSYETGNGSSTETSIVEPNISTEQEAFIDPTGLEESEPLIVEDPPQSLVCVEHVESVSEQATESEIDGDNISMQSDGSSWTDDYSTSQNEVVSEEESDNVRLLNRMRIHPPRTLSFHDSHRMNNTANVFSNLQIINNNFYSAFLNNGTTFNSGRARYIPPACNRYEKNTRRRQVKNSFLNSSTPNTSGDTRRKNTVHNTFSQKNECLKSSKIQNDLSTGGEGDASSSTASSLSVVDNDGSVATTPVKNTNILNKTQFSSMSPLQLNQKKHGVKEITQNEASTSVNECSVEPDRRDTNQSEESLGEPVVSHEVESSSVSSSIGAFASSSSIKKIQNADCIQNIFDSNSHSNPTVTTLGKENSFPLCNYIRTNHVVDRSKLVKNRSHQGVKLKTNSENNTVEESSKPVEKVLTNNLVQELNVVNIVNNDIAMPITEEDTESRPDSTTETIVSEGSAGQSVEEASEALETTNSEAPEFGSPNEPASCEDSVTRVNLNNTSLNNTTPSSSISLHSHNIVSVNNILHKDKRSNLNQLGRVDKQEDKFKNASKTKDEYSETTRSSVNCQVIKNSVKRNFNKLNTSSQAVNENKNLKCVEIEKQSTIARSGQSHSRDSAGTSSFRTCLPDSNSAAQSTSETGSSGGQRRNQQNNLADTSDQSSSATQHPRDYVLLNVLDMYNLGDLSATNTKNARSVNQNNAGSSRVVEGLEQHIPIKRSQSLQLRNNNELNTPINKCDKASLTKSNSFNLRKNGCTPHEKNTNSTKEKKMDDKLIIHNKLFDKQMRPSEQTRPAEGSQPLDELEELRLDEASNNFSSISLGPFSFNANNEPGSSQNSNNFSSKSRKHGEGSRSLANQGGCSSHVVIHNNINKKEKKCNEERKPVEPINRNNESESDENG